MGSNIPREKCSQPYFNASPLLQFYSTKYRIYCTISGKTNRHADLEFQYLERSDPSPYHGYHPAPSAKR